MMAPDGRKFDGGLEEVRARVAQVVNGPTAPFSAERNRALAEIRWFLASADGRAAGLKGVTAALVEVEDAQVFDGRDNELAKKTFYEALLKVRLFVVPIGLEI